MRFCIFRSVMTVLILLFLLLTFLLPSMYLNKVGTEMLSLIQPAMEHLKNEETEQALVCCNRLTEISKEATPRWERYLNHSSVAAFDAALAEAQVLCEIGEVAGALAALTAAKTSLEHLIHIELFEWNSLL